MIEKSLKLRLLRPLIRPGPCKLIVFHFSNCTIRFISTAQDRSIKGASQSSGSYLLRTNQLDLAITKKNLGHGDDLIEETRVIGYTR